MPPKPPAIIYFLIGKVFYPANFTIDFVKVNLANDVSHYYVVSFDGDSIACLDYLTMLSLSMRKIEAYQYKTSSVVFLQN